MNQPAKPPTPYEAIGGEPVLRRLVQRFYALMDELPEAYAVRRLHPASLAGSEQKLFEYLSGWLGGPPLYEAQYGHPRLRMRHLPFAIASIERDQWLMCMRMALDEVIAQPDLRQMLLAPMTGLADHMRNRPDTPEA